MAKKPKFDGFYTPEDEKAEMEIGTAFAASRGLTFEHSPNSRDVYDGWLKEGDTKRFLFELKNRNIASTTYPTIPIGKKKIEALFQEGFNQKIPALLVIHCKEDKVILWVPVNQLVNLPVVPNSGRTKTPMRESDREDCVYIPLPMFERLEMWQVA